MDIIILLTIIITSFIQSIFGTGVLLFGTPILLLFGYDFQNILIDNVDCVFSDFDRSVDNINKLMAWALYSMNDYSSIFIDGLCNYPEGFYYTKLLINKLNANKIPNFLSMHKRFIEEHTFSLTTIRKDDKHNTGQGGMCWIKTEPNNI